MKSVFILWGGKWYDIHVHVKYKLSFSLFHESGIYVPSCMTWAVDKEFQRNTSTLYFIELVSQFQEKQEVSWKQEN